MGGGVPGIGVIVPTMIGLVQSFHCLEIAVMPLQGRVESDDLEGQQLADRLKARAGRMVMGRMVGRQHE
jgi:hypothetical protein